MSLLCLDLGGAKTGLIIVHNGKVIAADVIITEKSTKRNISVANDDFDRTNEMVSRLIHFIQEYDVKAIIAELPAGSQSARAAKMFGLSIGAISGICYLKDLPVSFFTPGDVKKSFSGSKTASKDDMINNVIKTLRLNTRMVKGPGKARREIEICSFWFPEGTFEHIADAVGVWHIAKEKKTNLQLMFG